MKLPVIAEPGQLPMMVPLASPALWCEGGANETWWLLIGLCARNCPPHLTVIKAAARRHCVGLISFLVRPLC